MVVDPTVGFKAGGTLKWFSMLLSNIFGGSVHYGEKQWNDMCARDSCCLMYKPSITQAHALSGAEKPKSTPPGRKRYCVTEPTVGDPAGRVHSMVVDPTVGERW